MKSARITIGGLDVSLRPGEPVTAALPDAASQGSAGADGPPVILTVEHAQRPRCLLPPIISALAVLGLLVSLIAVLSRRRRCCED